LSLSLAIVISLINALYKGADVPLTIYSALVNPDGTLDPIKGITKKLLAAKEYGAKRFILSSENRRDVPQELLNDPDFEILFFENLDQVLRFLGVPPVPDNEDSSI
jgi:predicted ATP-dependent protease